MTANGSVLGVFRGLDTTVRIGVESTENLGKLSTFASNQRSQRGGIYRKKGWD